MRHRNAHTFMVELLSEDDEEIHFTHYGKTQREKRKSS